MSTPKIEDMTESLEWPRYKLFYRCPCGARVMTPDWVLKEEVSCGKCGSPGGMFTKIYVSGNDQSTKARDAMMIHKACSKCDWNWVTGAARCPECGAPPKPSLVTKLRDGAPRINDIPGQLRRLADEIEQAERKPFAHGAGRRLRR